MLCILLLVSVLAVLLAACMQCLSLLMSNLFYIQDSCAAITVLFHLMQVVIDSIQVVINLIVNLVIHRIQLVSNLSQLVFD